MCFSVSFGNGNPGFVCKRNWGNILAYITYCLSSHAYVLQIDQNPGSVAPAKNSRLSPLPPERAGFNYGLGDTVDIPIDGNAVSLNSTC